MSTNSQFNMEPAMIWSEPTTLSLHNVRLEPLSKDHLDDLIVAVKDGKLYDHWYTSIPEPQDMNAEINRRLDLQNKKSMLPFAVISMRNNKAVGMTTYMNIDQDNKRVEIGSTWYAKSVQRTSLNTECKLMLLEHAFERLDCICVEFRTHFMNHQSRRGIE